MTTAKEVVMEFIRCINEQDMERFRELMGEDHIFHDSDGGCHSGLESMFEGWKEYFKIFPDYRIEPEHIFEDGDKVAIFGQASGTYSVKGEVLEENYWEVPAAWLGIVEDGTVRHWHVCVNPEAILKIMAKYEK